MAYLKGILLQVVNLKYLNLGLSFNNIGQREYNIVNLKEGLEEL